MQFGEHVPYVGKDKSCRRKDGRHFFDDDIDDDDNRLVYCMHCGRLLNYEQVLYSVLRYYKKNDSSRIRR